MRSTNRGSWQEVRREIASPAEVLHVLKGRRLLVVGAVVFLAGVALFFGLVREPAYKADAAAAFVPGEISGDANAGETFAREVFSTVTTPAAFSEGVRSRAGWNGTPEDFRDRVVGAETFVTEGGTMGMRVTFAGRTPAEAARVANAYAAAFAREAARLDGGQLSGGASVVGAQVTQRAVPADGSEPGPVVYAAVAAGVGLLLGGAVALLLEGRTGGWRDIQDAEMTLRAPVLGSIPDYSAAENEG